LTFLVIRGKSEPERLNVNSENFVNYRIVKFLFVYMSGCLLIRLFDFYCHYHILSWLISVDGPLCLRRL